MIVRKKAYHHLRSNKQQSVLLDNFLRISISVDWIFANIKSIRSSKVLYERGGYK